MRKVTFSGLCIWAIALLFYLYEFFLGVFTGTLASELMDSFQIGPEQFSIIGSAYYFVYGCMQFPVGYLVERFGSRKSLCFASFICAFGTLWFSFASTFYGALLGRMLMGFGASFGFISILVLSLNWFPRKHFGLFTGLTQFLGTIGPLLAGGPLALAMLRLGNEWRFIFTLLSGIGFLIWLLILFFVRNKPKKDERAIVHLTPLSSSLIKELPSLFKIPSIWSIVIFGALIYASLPLLGAFWGTSYLQTRGFSKAPAAFIISLVWLGMAIGAPLYGKLSDALRRRKPLFIFSASIGLIGSLALLFCPTNAYFLVILFIIFIGLAGAGQAITFPTIAELVPSKYHASSLGLNNFFVVFSGAILPPFVSSIIQSASSGETLTQTGFTLGLTVMPLLFLLALVVGLFTVKETFCRQQREVHPIKP